LTNLNVSFEYHSIFSDVKIYRYVVVIKEIEMVDKAVSMLRLPPLYRIKYQNHAANKLKPSQALSKSMMRSKSLSYAEFCRHQIA
jgi:hypothetical protein